MNLMLVDVGLAIDDALRFPPPDPLPDICGEYYSPYYGFMWRIVDDMEPAAFAVELGCDQGRGLAALAIGGADVIGIDHTYKIGLDRVLPLFPNVTFLQRGSLPPSPEVTEAGRKIALLHIDTEHSYAQAQAEFEAYKPYLADGAVVIFDDLHAQDDAVLHYFVSLPYPKIIDDRMHPSCGWGVLLYTGDE